MVNTYVIVNPHIEGDFKSKIKATNSLDAANIFYKNLSEHFNNSVPKFYFTIQKGSSGDGKFYHFQVKEERDNNEVTYKIEQYKIHTGSETFAKFQNKLNNFKNKLNTQNGGDKSDDKKSSRKSRKDDDSSDCSTTENIYKRARTFLPIQSQPIYYWWYDPFIYNLNTLFIPTFYSYVTPYIELDLRLL
jgi:hypothetical protein